MIRGGLFAMVGIDSLPSDVAWGERAGHALRRRRVERFGVAACFALLMVLVQEPRARADDPPASEETTLSLDGEPVENSGPDAVGPVADAPLRSVGKLPGGAESLGGAAIAPGETSSPPEDGGNAPAVGESEEGKARDAGVRRRTPRQPGTCRQDGRWVVAQGEPFGGHWQGSPVPGILVFSSTGQEVRFDVEEGFTLEAVCWRTSNGIDLDDAELVTIDSDTYAVRVRSRSDAKLKHVVFDVDELSGQSGGDGGLNGETHSGTQGVVGNEDESEAQVLGSVLHGRVGLAQTGSDLLAIAGVDLLLLFSGALLLWLGRRRRHSPDRLAPGAPRGNGLFRTVSERITGGFSGPRWLDHLRLRPPVRPNPGHAVHLT
jgi:hypothetical protein